MESTMSLENIKKLSELFNSELQAAKLQLIEKKESILDKFNIEKLTLEKELKQIEESLEYFENENEMLTKALLLKEQDYSNTQTLYIYEKKNHENLQKERVKSLKSSKNYLEKFLEDSKQAFDENTLKNNEKISEYEGKIKSLDQTIDIYREYLGLNIEIIDKNKYSFQLQFTEKPKFKPYFEIWFLENGIFQTKAQNPMIDMAKEVDELNISKRFDIFLYKIREKFLKI